MTAPIEISLLPPIADRFKTDRLLDGRMLVRTSFGLHPTNRLLMEAAAEFPATTALGILLPDALPLIAFCMGGSPGRTATYYHFDLFHTETAREVASRNHCEGLHRVCAPDIPALPNAPELALFQLGKNAETALVCEMIRQAHARLAPGAKLLAAVQNTRDVWLRGQLEKTFGNLTLQRKDKDALLYLVKKKKEPDPKDAGHYTREIAVNFAGETLNFQTSYGVFNNDELDSGSRALLEMLEPPEPCRAILDLGCGWGALGLLAGRRLKPARLTMIDANARAVALARANAEAHPVSENIQVRLESDAESILYEGAEEEVGTYDLVLSNPPYSTEFRVTDMFLRAAHRALRPGGAVWFVTKTNPLLEERMRGLFGEIRVLKRRGYHVFHAVKTAKKNR